MDIFGGGGVEVGWDEDLIMRWREGELGWGSGGMGWRYSEVECFGWDVGGMGVVF